MKKLKIYLDTSVINFLFADDAPDLKAATHEFFYNFIKVGIYDTYVSDFVLQEINKTKNDQKKEQLIRVIEDYPIELLDLVQRNEIDVLANAYLQNNVVPPNKIFDALHIAASTVCKINYLISWNYKHLANINRERKVQAINLANNYLDPIRICTPLELLDYGK